MHPDILDYDLPPELIAQEPCAERDQSRLMVVRRSDNSLQHHVFADLPELLDAGDLLILNDTRVLSARLLGRRARTAGKWEGLFLRQSADGSWELLCQTRGYPEIGEEYRNRARAAAAAPWSAARRSVTGSCGRTCAGSVEDLLARHGQVPLPPYIRKGRAGDGDRERYQTVYADRAGAVAAPTAGLHFTPRVFERLRQRGIGWAFVTLHVGPGTFQPIQVEDITQHRMHREWGEVSAATAAAITTCKARGGRSRRGGHDLGPRPRNRGPGERGA